MSDSAIEGNWWLPESPDRKVSGTLIAEQSQFRLVTHDALRAYTAPEAINGVISHNVGGPTVVTHAAVHGYTRDHKAITILNATGVDMSGPFEAATESFSLDIALFGAHITSNSFSSVMIEFDWLDPWLDPPSISGPGAGPIASAVIENMPITLHEVAVDGATMQFRVHVVGSQGAKKIDLLRTSTVTVRPTESNNWQTLMNRWVRPVQDFLTVAIGRTVQMTHVHLKPTDETRWGDKNLAARFRTTQPRSLHLGTSDREEHFEDFASYTSPAITTARHLGGQLPNVFEQWMNEWPKHSGIVALLVAHMYAPFMYTANRYGAIFQAVEGYSKLYLPGGEKPKSDHRQRVASIIEAVERAGIAEADTAWAKRVLQSRNDKPLRQRIDEVVDSTESMGRAIRSATTDFGYLAASLRAGVAHPRDSDDKQHQPLATAQYWYGEALLWLGRAVLLHRAGVVDAFDRCTLNPAFTFMTKELSKAETMAKEALAEG